MGVFVFMLAGNAHAYVDPGTGSYILQIVIAGIVGAAFTLKLLWRRLALFFGRFASKEKDRTEERPPADNG